MKIVKIIGGLGNQMFQYAFALELQRRHPDEEVKLDTHLFDSYDLHNGYELGRLFNLSLEEASRKEISRMVWCMPYGVERIVRRLWNERKRVTMPSGKFDLSVLDLSDDRYYDGVWQDARLFADSYDRIVADFRLKTPLDGHNQTVAAKMRSDNGSVSVHVRRGDYLNHSIYRGLCGIDYYEKAINHVLDVVDSPVFYIFSNDLGWCRENLIPLIGGHEAVFVDWNAGADSYKDMVLMSACRINVIANSSFSWWGAYLNRHPDKIVIAPEKWTNSCCMYTRQLPSWVCL